MGQPSTSFGSVQLDRQDSGSVTFNGAKEPYSGAFASFADILGGFAGTFLIHILANKYVALAFTPSCPMQFSANTSHGNPGVLSVSDQPGDFSSTAHVVMHRGAGNNLNISTDGASGNCRLNAGQEYFINFADVNVNTGAPNFYNAKDHTQSIVSYGVSA